MRKEITNFQLKYGKAVQDFGFVQAPNILFRHKKRLGLTSSELIVLVYLLSYYREAFEPISLASLKTLSRNTGLSTATVHRAKVGLVKKGFMKSTKPRKPNKYGTNYYDFVCLRVKLDAFAKNLIRMKLIEGKVSDEKAGDLIGDQTIKASGDFLAGHV